MEITKIKISPEVLKNDIVTQTYSGFTFGYYSGLTQILSQVSVVDYRYQYGTLSSFGGFLDFAGDFVPPVGTFAYRLGLFRFTLDFIDTFDFFKTLPIGTKITITKANGESFEFYLRNLATFEDSSIKIFLNLYSVNNITFVDNEIINLHVSQNISLLNDMSIPILLKQSFEDIGYYSPFDGNISQLNKTLNFIFSANTLNPYSICVSNTSDTSLVYTEETNYIIDWGDGSAAQNITVFFPESLCHLYNPDGPTGTYNISLTGTNKLGNFLVSKSITVPYDIVESANPFGTVYFVSNSGSWGTTPTEQNYINFLDANNTITGQVSSNFVSVPFVVSGFTESKLNDLKGFGINPFVVGKTITLSNGDTGQVTFLGPEYTAYTINNLQYFDFPSNISVFYANSSGFTDTMLTQSAITKFEYLMNVIEEPIIQTNVFIERGKNTGLESFRRIGEVSNIVALQDYGYKFFELRNYNDL